MSLALPVAVFGIALWLAPPHGGYVPPPPPPPPDGGSTGGGPGGPTGGGVPTPGGSWSGPGDTRPSTPTPSGPRGPSTGGGRSGPSTGGGAPPASPSTPTPASGVPAGGAAPSGPTSVGGPSGTPPSIATGGAAAHDVTDWEIWWRFQRDELLELRTRIRAGLEANSSGWEGLDSATGRARIDHARIVRTVLPRVRELLIDERNPDVLTSTLIALGKIGGGAGRAEAPGIHAAILPFLSDRVQEVTETAVLALGLNGEPAAARVLSAIAHDTEEGRKLAGASEVPTRSRAFACFGLGLLARRIRHVDVKRYASAELRRVHDRDRSATRDVRVAAVSALALLAPPEHSEPSGDEARAEVVFDAEVEWLLAITRDTSAHEAVRAAAANTIARLSRRSSPAARSAAALLFFTELESPTTRSPSRRAIVQALGALADPRDARLEARIRTHLERQLREGEAFTRGLAAVALARRAKHVEFVDERARIAPLLRAHVEAAPSTVRPWFVLATGLAVEFERRRGVSTPARYPEWVQRGLAECKGASESGAWVLTAGLVGAPSAEQSLMSIATGGRRSSAQHHAALALGLLPAWSAERTLDQLLSGSLSRPGVLLDASIGLGLLGSRRASATLLELSERANGLDEQSAVAAAFSYVGDARSLDPLLARLPRGARPDRQRAFPVVTIGALADDSPLPWNAELASSACPWLAPATLHEPSTGTGILDLF